MVSSCYAIYQYIQTQHLYVTGFYIHHSIFGSFLAMALPVIAALYVEERSVRKRGLYLAAALFRNEAMILSQARGPWVGAAVGLLIVGYVMRREIWDNKKAVAIAVITMVLFIANMQPLYSERAKSLSDPKYPSNYNRLYIWQSSINMIRDYPLTGVGFGQFREIYNSRYLSLLSPERYHPHAHNSFLMMGAETGLISLLAFLYLLFHIYKWLSKVCCLQPVSYNAAVLAIIGAITVNSMVDHFFWAPYLAKMIWSFLGVSVYASGKFISSCGR